MFILYIDRLQEPFHVRQELDGHISVARITLEPLKKIAITFATYCFLGTKLV